LSTTGVLESAAGPVEEEESQAFQLSAETEPKRTAAAAAVVAFMLIDLIGLIRGYFTRRLCYTR